MNSMFLLTSSVSLSSVSTRELLGNYNAIDFSLLIGEDYLAVEPDGATQLTAERYSNYLWLFKKTTAAAGQRRRSRKTSRRLQADFRPII